MPPLLKCVFLVFCFQLAEFSHHSNHDGGREGECVIELECEECLPEHMPAVTSHGAREGAVRAAAGEEVALSCGAGHFLEFPRAELVARCEASRYRVDGHLHHLLDLGCQQDIMEDVLHSVEDCAPPLQGRAYETQEGGRTHHLATLCFDPDRALPVWLRTSGARDLSLGAHSDVRAPLSILGNFNHMFDASTRHEAERLYSDEARLNRRLHELYKHDRYSFAEQKLTAAKMLGSRYFEARDVRASSFPSNEVLSWRSVVAGNWRHLQEDVSALVSRRGGALQVYAGTHGVASLAARDSRPLLYLKAGRRFPVARYLWTVLHAPHTDEGVALVLLNDPFVTVSEIRAAVFCASACSRLSWLEALTRHRNYERPLLGLVFCCELNEFAATVGEMPRIFNSTVRLLT